MILHKMSPEHLQNVWEERRSDLSRGTLTFGLQAWVPVNWSVAKHGRRPPMADCQVAWKDLWAALLLHFVAEGEKEAQLPKMALHRSDPEQVRKWTLFRVRMSSCSSASCSKMYRVAMDGVYLVSLTKKDLETKMTSNNIFNLDLVPTNQEAGIDRS